MANIKLDYGNMSEAARALQEAKTQLDSLLSRVDSDVSSLVASGFRTPTSSVAFDQQFTEFTGGTVAALMSLAQFASFLDTAVATFEEADSGLASSARELF